MKIDLSQQNLSILSIVLYWQSIVSIDKDQFDRQRILRERVDCVSELTVDRIHW